METNDDFGLFIKKNIKKKLIFNKVPKNPSILSDYKAICLEINKIITKKDELKENDVIPFIIFLEHHNHKKIEINNKEEWDILYNFNIINECIINKNKLKIDYKIIDEKDNNSKTLDIKKILNYITDKLPKDYFLNLFLQFFSINKDISDLFKKFFIGEIQKAKINEIEKELVIKNEQLKECTNNSINIEQTNDDNSNNKIESQEYSSFLEQVEKDPNIILCHCKNTDNRNEYLEKFYSLLLFFYSKLKEEKKIKELLKKQEFRNIFLKIIDIFYLYDDIKLYIRLPDEFIFEVLLRKKITGNKELYRLISLRDYEFNDEKVLSFISNNCNSFSNYLKMSELHNDEKDIGDINKVIIYIKEINEYQNKYNKNFIKFDESFCHIIFENVIKNNNDDINKKYNNLLLIQKISSQKINYNYLFEILKKLENDKLIDLIEKIIEDNILISEIELSDLARQNKLFDILFCNFHKYCMMMGISESEIIVSKLFNIVNERIDFKKADDKLIETLDKSKKFKYIFKALIIEKIKNNCDNEIMFKIFNLNDSQLFDDNTLYEIINHRINFMQVEKSPHSIKELSSFIYFFDQIYKKMNENLHMPITDYLYLILIINDIEKKFMIEVVVEIYLNLIDNNKDLTQYCKYLINNYFYRNFYEINNKAKVIVLNSSIFDEFNFKEEDFWNPIKNNKFFETLKTVSLKKEIFVNCPGIYDTNYMKKTHNIISIIKCSWRTLKKKVLGDKILYFLNYFTICLRQVKNYLI